MEIKIGDEVYFSPQAHYKNIIGRCTLYELKPKKGIIVGIEQFKGVLGGNCFSYKISCDKYNMETYQEIHTVFLTQDEYYMDIAEQISCGPQKINIFKSIKIFFNIT